MTTISETQPITFHTYEEQRQVPERIQHVVQAFFGQLLFLLQMIPHRLLSKETVYTPCAVKGEDGKFHYHLDQLPWNQTEKSDGLYLFVHGLHGSPLHWRNYFSVLDKEKPGFHYVAPHVPLKGNCPLEEACVPILDIVQNYLKKNPGKPIHLIGTSNGSRIISYIETQLSPEAMQGRVLTVSSIAGVHHGTTWISTLKKTRVAFLNAQLAQELTFKSEFSQTLLELWKDKQREWKAAGITACHHFYATTEDEMVRPISSSLPILQEKDTHRIYHGYGHSHIVEAVRKEVLKTIASS